MRELFAISALLAGPALAEVSFEPIPITPHVYDGGWEHFVGGGLAVLDCNGDAYPDMVAAGGINSLSLYINKGTGISFFHQEIDITGSTGVYPMDFDGDSRLDLVVLRVGPDQFLQGNGSCGFTPVNLRGITFEDQWTTAFSATWEAGKLSPTLVFGHYVDRTDPEGPFEACDSNTLWRHGHGGYKPTELAPGYCTLSALFTDWRREGQADLRLSNDRHYYVSEGHEQLWEMTIPPRLFGSEDGWKNHKLWGMGIATRDLDRDGMDEVYLSSMGDQRLMRWTGSGAGFEDVPFEQGTAAHRPYVGDDGRPSTGWHIAFGDIQNDGLDDAFIAKGNVQQMPGNAMEDPNNLLIQQPDGTFSEAGATAGVASLHRARGAALADFDQDGRLDLAVVNRRAPLELWRNTSDAGNWLTVDLLISGPNTHGVGSWIEVDDGQTVQSREVTVGGGHAGGVALPQHFGLGEVKSIRMRLRLPGQEWTEWQEVQANQRLRVTRDGTATAY